MIVSLTRGPFPVRIIVRMTTKTTRRFRLPLWATLIIVVIVVLGLTAFAGLLLTPHKPGQTPPIHLFSPPQARSDLGDTFNILMSGHDARLLGDKSMDGLRRNPREKVYHSDMIIIAHFNLPQRRVTMVSIPRDFLVTIPGVTHAQDRTDFLNLDKITHASAYGQDALLVKTVELNFGIRIARHVALDFDSFRMGYRLLQPFLGKLVFYNRNLSTPDSALLFVRDRHHYANDDFDRSRHALLFVKTVLERLWPRLEGKFLQWVLSQGLLIMGHDTDMSPDDMQYVIQQLRSRRFIPDSIEDAVLIGAGSPVTLAKYGQTLSCCLPAWNEVEKQVDFYIRDQRDVQALSYMEEEQKVHWPDYVFADYDLMPDTTKVDTTNPVYLRLMMEKDSLRPMDSSMLRIRDSLARLPGALTSSPSKADTSHPKTGTKPPASNAKAKPDTTKKSQPKLPSPPNPAKSKTKRTG
jgi:hypothetical protein